MDEYEASLVHYPDHLKELATNVEGSGYYVSPSGALYQISGVFDFKSDSNTVEPGGLSSNAKLKRCSSEADLEDIF
uniref:Uncharacterized protein n=1 Tax=Arundo donax TaxID=35708 RepID=A0A0A8Y963_ARUDO